MAIENDRPLREGDTIIVTATVSFDHEGDGRRVHMRVEGSGENLWVPREACDLGPEVIRIGDKVQIGPHHAAEVIGVTSREVWIRLPSGLTSVKPRYEVFRWHEPLQIEDPAVAEPAVEVGFITEALDGSAPTVEFTSRSGERQIHPDYEMGSERLPIPRKQPFSPEEKELIDKLTAPRVFSKPADADDFDF